MSMMYPTRYNPSLVRYQQKDCATVEHDPVWGEPLAGRAEGRGLGPVIEVEAQVNRGSKMARRLERQYSGDGQNAAGHLVFTVDWLTDAGLTLRVGDRIVGIAYRVDGSGAVLEWEDVQYEVIDVRPESPLRGGMRLVYAVFAEVKEGRAGT